MSHGPHPKWKPFERVRIPEPAFRCGFNPEGQSYARYVNHIGVCEHRDCKRRFTNHMVLQSYFARKYGDSGKISGNVASGEGAPAHLPTHRPPRLSGVNSAEHKRREDEHARAERANRTSLGGPSTLHRPKS